MSIDFIDIVTRRGTVRVHQAGPEGAPVLCFAHGALVAADIWFDLIACLEGHYRCVAPELPLGSHPIPLRDDADTSPPGVADLVVDVLDALSIERAVLVGNDSGGAVAQLVAARHPDRVERLVLTNSDAFEIFPPRAYAYMRLFRFTALARTMARLLVRWPALGLLPLTWGPLATHMTRERVRVWLTPLTQLKGVARDFGKFIGQAVPRHTLAAARELAHFERPVHVIWGTADPFFRLALAHRIVAHVPDGTLVEVPNARTYVMLDAPEAVAKAIREAVR